MSTTFWNTPTLEPKRQFRFLLRFGGLGDAVTFACKSITKPTATLDATSHQFLNHTFKYPNRVVWQPVSVVLVDMATPDMSATLLKVLRASGYDYPDSLADAAHSITKNQATKPFNSVEIVQLGKPLTDLATSQNMSGQELSVWQLNNAFINGTIDFGGELSYENDGLVEVRFDLEYDYAYMTKSGGSARATNNKWGIEKPGQKDVALKPYK